MTNIFVKFLMNRRSTVEAYNEQDQRFLKKEFFLPLRIQSFYTVYEKELFCVMACTYVRF